mmetsp:Transcript_13138/g.44488  ORF Transcript_13138/g.44488 Transcript_13138/m.44488 type:complete len:337 (+) Transcript_13138:356-1366(+)
MVVPPPMMVHRRSRPKAMPPCGGAPKLKAPRRNPNWRCASSGVKPRSLKVFICISRSWMRMDPPPTSTPLMTMSYALARTEPGAVSIIGASSGLQLVNGWCMATKRSSSSSHSRSGKSTTQSAAKGPVRRPSCSAMALRILPMAVCVLSRGPAKTQMRSPSCASQAAAHCAKSAASKNFLADESNSRAPSLRLFTLTQTRPLAPMESEAASLSRAFTWAFDQVPALGQEMPTTYSASSNTLKFLPLTTSVSSCSFIPNRRSGLSMPYWSMASCQVIRGKGGRSTPLVSLKSARIIDSKVRSTSSWVTKESSQSICVNSGCRSARSSSSRKHFTIWK